MPVMSSPRIPHQLVVRPGSPAPTPCSSPTPQKQLDDATRASPTPPKLTPNTKFIVLKSSFVFFCILDIVHWAYMLRDDTDQDKNTWKFYQKQSDYEMYYLIARMFGDIFTAVLGLGAAMWTRKISLTIPCLILQMLFVLFRMIVWPIRYVTWTDQKDPPRNEDLFFVACEFAFPSVWAILAGLVIYILRSLSEYEHVHGYVQPPLIVLTVKNDENDESVQIEIA